MKRIVGLFLRKIGLYYPLRSCLAERRYRKECKGQSEELAAWQQRGRPMPPPQIAKRQVLEAYAGRFGLKVFVETGTYYGDTVKAMLSRFERIYSIELGMELHKMTKWRFRKAQHVELIHGDSGVEMAKVINSIDRPALFWLDSHYSAAETARGETDTPIFQELSHILAAPDRGHVIIIDDARSFGKDPAYPNIEELTAFVRAKRANVDITVEGDSIRITPQRAAP